MVNNIFLSYSSANEDTASKVCLAPPVPEASLDDFLYNAGADALGSGFAIYTYLKDNNKNVRLVYSGLEKNY